MDTEVGGTEVVGVAVRATTAVATVGGYGGYGGGYGPPCVSGPLGLLHVCA